MGSSIKSTSASWAKACATITRWRCPPESSPKLALALGPTYLETFSCVLNDESGRLRPKRLIKPRSRKRDMRRTRSTTVSGIHRSLSMLLCH